MPEEAQRWLEQAEEDLKTAELIFQEKRYYAASYFAQQAAEKALKAVLVWREGELPPRTHDLRQLARQAETPREWLPALTRLSRIYLISRYPELTPGTIPAREIDYGDSVSHLELAQTVLAWVREQLLTQS